MNIETAITAAKNLNKSTRNFVMLMDSTKLSVPETNTTTSYIQQLWRTIDDLNNQLIMMTNERNELQEKIGTPFFEVLNKFQKLIDAVGDCDNGPPGWCCEEFYAAEDALNKIKTGFGMVGLVEEGSNGKD